jgi:hypothetical protein
MLDRLGGSLKKIFRGILWTLSGLLAIAILSVGFFSGGTTSRREREIVENVDLASLGFRDGKGVLLGYRLSRSDSGAAENVMVSLPELKEGKFPFGEGSAARAFYGLGEPGGTGCRERVKAGFVNVQLVLRKYALVEIQLIGDCVARGQGVRGSLGSSRFYDFHAYPRRLVGKKD